MDSPVPRDHNNPPPDLLVGDDLRAKLARDHENLTARKDQLVDAGNRIPEVNDEDSARKVSDFVVQLSACAKAADAARVGEKEPYLNGGRVVDGFFKAISDPLDVVKKKAERSLTEYHRAVAAAERARREEEARKAAEAAAEARRKAEEEARAIADAKSLQDAVAAEKAAEQAAADAALAAKAADAKPADLSRTRGEFGAVSSLRTFWDFDSLDREKLDLETLRNYLPQEGLESAIRSFIKIGGRTLNGVRIFENTKVTVR